MTYTEFLEKLEVSTHAEWVKGEALIFVPPSVRHQDLAQFLTILLATFVRIFDLGKLLTAPCEMRLETSNSAREPDLLFVAKANSARITENRIIGAADLVIEIISPESVSRDRAEKFYEYQANGVREYWLIDPRPTFARTDFWVLEEGRYRAIPIAQNGIYHSTVLPNFAFNVNSLLQEELPDPIKTLVEMVGLDTFLRSIGQG